MRLAVLRALHRHASTTPCVETLAHLRRFFRIAATHLHTSAQACLSRGKFARTDRRGGPRRAILDAEVHHIQTFPTRTSMGAAIVTQLKLAQKKKKKSGNGILQEPETRVPGPRDRKVYTYSTIPRGESLEEFIASFTALKGLKASLAQQLMLCRPYCERSKGRT